MPTSLVTGGAGFLGSHLCEALLQRGHRVICIDNLVVSTLENIDHLRDDAFTFVNHDVIQPIECNEPVDFVYHLAALASPIDYLRMPLHSLKTGSNGTHHALGLAKWKRARFLLASTSEVYGDPEVHPQPETYWGNVNPIGPRGVYDEAKRYAEALTMAYHRQQGVNTAVVRIFNTYGPRMRANDGRAIPTFLRQALEGKPVTVFGDGSQTRSFCYVDDLIRGIVLLGESHEHLPVNLGNPDEKTLVELAETILRLTGSSSEIVYEALPVDDPQVRQPDITRATADPRLGAGDRARGRPAQDDRVARARGRRRLRVSSLGDRYEEHHRERRDEGDFVFVPERIPLLVAAIGTGKRVLDLGCRSGALTRHFLEGNSVVGLDVDASALEKAATLGIEPVQANVEEPLPFADASFDAVVAGELFEHLQFPDALVAEIGRVLRPRGTLAGSVPNAFRLQSRLRFLRGRSPEDDPTHLRMFSPDAMRELLADFENVELSYVGGRYARLSARLFARDLVFTGVKP